MTTMTRDHRLPILPPMNPIGPAVGTFADLSRGKSLGKAVDLLVQGDDSARIVNPAAVNMLEVMGDDGAAQNLQLTIKPPKGVRIGTGAGQLPLATAQQAVDSQSLSGVTRANLAGNLVLTPLIGLLEWGVGGTNVEKAEVDISNGVCLNLTCSFLRVGVQVDPMLALLSVNLGSDAAYEVSGFVGPGFPKPNNGQRTYQLGNINVADGIGVSPIVPIPQFANRLKLVAAPVEGVAPVDVQGWVLQVLFFSFNQGYLYSSGWNPATVTDLLGSVLVVDNGSSGEGIPIPNGAGFVGVVSYNYSLNVQAVFSLGI